VGTSKDLAEALRWYEKAAVAGDPDGMTGLGRLLVDRKDYSEGRRWLEKAAAAGSADAQAELKKLSKRR
jgi:TPR repeat protein